MGFLKFLKALRTLADNGNITINEAYKFARQEFGEVSDLLKLQINKIFKDADAPSIKKPENKNNVFTFVPKDKLRPAQMEEATGIETLKNPYRAAGPLDPVEGMTRAAARVVLNKRGIKIPERGDPIDIFEENFGGDALMDLKNVADELLQTSTTGNVTKNLDNILETEGMFDLKIDKTLPKGMSNKELLEKMEEVEQEDILKKFDPEDREPNAKGGRVGYEDGGITSLPKGLQKDTTTGEGANIFNMYAEKEDDNTFNMYAERPEKSFKEDLEFIKKLKGGVGTNTILYMVKEAMDKALERGEITKEKHTEMLMPFFGEASEKITEKMYNEDMGNYATGGRVGFAVGSLPKGIQALVKLINKKFGKGAMKTADEMDRPKSAKEKEMFEEFETRNPNPKRQLTDDEIKEYEEELGDSETWMSEGTVEEAERALKRQKEYEAAMYRDYKAGKLDPQPGEKGRKEFLEKKLEDMEMSGDKRLMTRDEIEELSTFDLGTQMEEFKNTKSRLQKKYKGIIDDDLLSKMMVDDNPQRLAEVEAAIDQALELMKKGKSSDEVLDIMKQMTDRTKQAGGGLSYLSGF